MVTTILIAGWLAGCGGAEIVRPLATSAVPEFDATTHGIIINSSFFTGNYKGEEPISSASRRVFGRFRCDKYHLLFAGTDAGTDGHSGDLAAILAGGSTWEPSDPHDFAVTDGLGSVHALLLPAGRYKIFFYAAWCGNSYFYSDNLSVPFEVQAGALNYLGEFGFHHTFRRKSDGIVVSSGAELKTTANRVRDLEIMRQRHPWMADYPVRTIALELESRAGGS